MISLEEKRPQGSQYAEIANLVFNQFIRDSPKVRRRRGSSQGLPNVHGLINVDDKHDLGIESLM